MKISRILLDLDCVLADFVGGVARIWGLTVPELMASWTPGEYPMNTALASALNRKFPPGPEGSHKTVGDAAFWGAIQHASPGFWRKLEPLPWATDLVSLVAEYTDKVYIVTAPSRCPHCIPEKREWCRKFFGHPEGYWYDHLIPTPHKELLGKPGVVLVDDSFDNCYRFTQENGSVVLFPAHHNPLHMFATDPMPVVRRRLKELAS